MNYKHTLLLFFIGCSSVVLGYQVQSDRQAYDYCATHQNAFVAVVWPIAQGNERLITALMERFGNIIYRKEYFFTPSTAFYVLQKAHADAHISNMKKHVKWYFPSGTYQQPARIFVLEFNNVTSACMCKYAIRKIFPGLQYRSIHINDFHYETVELAKIFFNKGL